MSWADGSGCGLRRYSEHPDEVDRWIDRVDEEARRAQQIWERRQDALA